MRYMRYLILFILAVLLTACGNEPKKAAIMNTLPTPFPTVELLIAPPDRATPTAWLSPMSATAKAMIDLHHPDVAYGVPITPLPQSTKASSPGGFDPVIIGDFRLDYLGHSIQTATYTGTRYVEIRYNFTNNSSETTSFGWSISTKAFQDGIELTDYIILGSEAVTEIRPGKSITIKDGFQIRSETSAIELEFTPFLSLWADIISRTIKP